MSDGWICTSCGDEVTAKTALACDECGARFHLAPALGYREGDCGVILKRAAGRRY